MPPGGCQQANGGRIGEAIVAEARSWIGTPFHWEASVKGVGCDCKGLLAGVARACGRGEGDSIEALLGGYSRRIDGAALRAGLARLFLPVQPRADWHPGDILQLAVGATRAPVHLALYAGAGTMIHTYSKGPAAVIEVPLGQVWRAAVVSAWRWKSLDRPPAAEGSDRTNVRPAASMPPVGRLFDRSGGHNRG